MRAEVRVIQDQEVEIKEAEISQTEKEMLLSKYGYKSSDISQYIDTPNELTFEEMCQIEENKRKREQQEKIQRMNGPKPITFDNSNYYSNENFETDEGITFKISVVSDMPL